MSVVAKPLKIVNPAAAADDWSLSTFLEDKRSQFPGFLWEPFLPKESLVMLAAEPFSGKSMFCLGLGLALAQGEAFLGSQARQVNVLYVGVDSALWDYGTQIRRLLQGRGAPAGFHFLPEPYRLADRTWRARVGEYIQAHAIQLMVLDTLRATHDKEENDSGDMQLIMNELRAINVEYGASVLFIHHRPKPSEGGQSDYRGSSVFHGSADVFLGMKAERLGESKSLLTLTCRKGRGIGNPAPLDVMLDWDTAAGTASLNLATQAFAKPIRSLGEAVDARLSQGPATIAELTAAVPSDGRAKKTVRNKVDVYLKNKRLAGLVEAEREGGRNVWHLVREAGKEAV